MVHPPEPLLLVHRPRVHRATPRALAALAAGRDQARRRRSGALRAARLRAVHRLQRGRASVCAVPQLHVPQPRGRDHPREGARSPGAIAPHRRVAVRAVAGRVDRRRVRSDLVWAMSERHVAVARRPALMHLFWWFMFAQGGVIAALLIPVHVLIQGILGPLGLVKVVDRHYDTWVQVLGNPLVKLYLLVLIAVPFFHFAHRLRYLMVDLGVPAAKSMPAQVVFYGGAILVTLVTIYVLLTTAPISF